MEKLNIVLDEPVRSSGEYLEDAIIAMENSINDTALWNFRLCSENAMTGQI